ncbi:hypothetical protein, partial [Porphyromonas loveana]|uniref:hypothetical protein n=1 Tax=Porphyromonas loveana TaxID=1884669 RepID=UPI00359F3A87
WPKASKRVGNSTVDEQRAEKAFFLLKNCEQNAEKSFFNQKTVDKESKNDFSALCRRFFGEKIIFRLFVDEQ